MKHREWDFPKPKAPLREPKGGQAKGQMFGAPVYLNTSCATIASDFPGDVQIQAGEGSKVYLDGDVVVRGSLTFEIPTLTPARREAASRYLKQKVRGR